MPIVDPRTYPRKWGAAIASGDVKKALSMYTPNAVLVPTYSSSILQGRKELASYFREFMSRPNMRVTITKVVMRRDKSAPTPAVSGFYTIAWGNGGPNETASARFTYLLEPYRTPTGDVDWKAITHHSSVVP